MFYVASVWHPLFMFLRRHSPLRWQAGAHDIPDWRDARLHGRHYIPETESKQRLVTCATARHEVIEAPRWARKGMAQGVPAQDIAFAAAPPGRSGAGADMPATRQAACRSSCSAPSRATSRTFVQRAPWQEAETAALLAEIEPLLQTGPNEADLGSSVPPY